MYDNYVFLMGGVCFGLREFIGRVVKCSGLCYSFYIYLVVEGEYYSCFIICMMIIVL